MAFPLYNPTGSPPPGSQPRGTSTPTMSGRQPTFGSQPNGFTGQQTQGPLAGGFYGRPGTTPQLGAPVQSRFGTPQGNTAQNHAPQGTGPYNPVPGSAAPTGPVEGPLSGPGYEEEFYKKYGQDLMNKPSSSEELFAQGMAASNPFYDYAQQQTIKAINDATAAGGSFNSSFREKNIGNAVADLRGQQAHELAQLAGQADKGRIDRYDTTGDFAHGAQDAMEDRARGAIDDELDLARGRGGLVGDFYGEGGREAQQAKMAEIEAALKKSGLSAEETKQMMQTIFGVGQVISSAVS